MLASYILGTTANAPAAVEALLDAPHRHPGADPAGLAIRSDHGSRHTSEAFSAAVRTLGLGHEYIGYKTPQQNGHPESFQGKPKFEYVWPSGPESFQEAEEIILGAFVDYSKRRLHSAIGCMQPPEFAAKCGPSVFCIIVAVCEKKGCLESDRTFTLLKAPYMY